MKRSSVCANTIPTTGNVPNGSFCLSNGHICYASSPSTGNINASSGTNYVSPGGVLNAAVNSVLHYTASFHSGIVNVTLGSHTSVLPTKRSTGTTC